MKKDKGKEGRRDKKDKGLEGSSREREIEGKIIYIHRERENLYCFPLFLSLISLYSLSLYI